MGKDSTKEIADLILRGVQGTDAPRCDVVLLTGGVSAGDFDLTPDAMQMAGTKVLIRGLNLKPGMAGAYGVIQKDNAIPVLAFSGNPAACMTAFWLVGAPVLRKLAGWNKPRLTEIRCALMNRFPKKSGATRVLRGKLVFTEGKACLAIDEKQGNRVLSSAIGTDLLAVIPAGSGPMEAGAVLRGFRITD